MTGRIDVGVVGATGTVGQQCIALLAGHPWFRLAWLGGSERFEGRPYRDAVQWRLAGTVPDEAASLSVEAARPGVAPALVLSALDASVAGDLEPAFATAGHLVVSNARSHRLDEVVPLVVPKSTPIIWSCSTHSVLLADGRAGS